MQICKIGLKKGSYNLESIKVLNKPWTAENKFFFLLKKVYWTINRIFWKCKIKRIEYVNYT